MNTGSEQQTASEAQQGAGAETIVRIERSSFPSPKEPNKTEKVLSLLKRPKGAMLDELVEATAWLPHTTRAALTGLKKKGYVIQRTKHDGASRYSLEEDVSR